MNWLWLVVLQKFQLNTLDREKYSLVPVVSWDAPVVDIVELPHKYSGQAEELLYIFQSNTIGSIDPDKVVATRIFYL